MTNFATLVSRYWTCTNHEGAIRTTWNLGFLETKLKIFFLCLRQVLVSPRLALNTLCRWGCLWTPDPALLTSQVLRLQVWATRTVLCRVVNVRHACCQRSYITRPRKISFFFFNKEFWKVLFKAVSFLGYMLIPLSATHNREPVKAWLESSSHTACERHQKANLFYSDHIWMRLKIQISQLIYQAGLQLPSAFSK